MKRRHALEIPRLEGREDWKSPRNADLSSRRDHKNQKEKKVSYEFGIVGERCSGADPIGKRGEEGGTRREKTGKGGKARKKIDREGREFVGREGHRQDSIRSHGGGESVAVSLTASSGKGGGKREETAEGQKPG